MDFASSTRAAEDMKSWNRVFAKSSVVPQGYEKDYIRLELDIEEKYGIISR